MRCHGVHDLAVAEAQYHRHCYDEFRKFPVHADQTSIDDEAMKYLADEMYSKQKLCTWTSLNCMMSYGGQLTQ